VKVSNVKGEQERNKEKRGRERCVFMRGAGPREGQDMQIGTVIPELVFGSWLIGPCDIHNLASHSGGIRFVTAGMGQLASANAARLIDSNCGRRVLRLFGPGEELTAHAIIMVLLWFLLKNFTSINRIFIWRTIDLDMTSWKGKAIDCCMTGH
jgi:hypothetical protein